MNKPLGIAVLTVLVGLAGLSQASPLNHPGMRKLCAQAETRRFVPMDGVQEKPHPEPLFQAIESGAGYKRIQKMLTLHPEWVNRPQSKAVVDGLLDKIGARDVLDDSDQSEATPLDYAAFMGNWPAAQALIDAGAKVNPTGKVDGSPLESAVQGGQFEIACQLLLKGAVLPTDQMNRGILLGTAMLVDPARYNDSAQFIDYLLTQGFDVNGMNSPGETPLMGAISLGNIPVAETLLKRNARIDLRRRGHTALSMAQRMKQARLASRLQRCIAAGATTCPSDSGKSQ